MKPIKLQTSCLWRWLPSVRTLCKKSSTNIVKLTVWFLIRINLAQSGCFKEFPDGKYNPDVDLEKCLDALIDLEYVLLGTVHLHGFSGIYDQAFARVQAANMSKIRAERPEDSKRGTGFDVVKPEGWEAPVFADLLDHDPEA